MKIVLESNPDLSALEAILNLQIFAFNDECSLPAAMGFKKRAKTAMMAQMTVWGVTLDVLLESISLLTAIPLPI